MSEPDLSRTPKGIDAGEAGASSLIDAVYGQLCRIAQWRMAEERRDHTLQATALVHEVYLRLFKDGDLAERDRAQFFAAAGEAMRRILIEHARRRGRVKRGGGSKRVDLQLADVADLSAVGDEEIVALDEAFRRLESVDARAASVVSLRFYAGLTIEQTAEALGLSERTVKRDWEFARSWLYSEMTRDDERD
ncbi:MAG: sigma-70 family RNA polymerase sigma factor [Phycisphaerales bacterium]|nr:sigma-70 family RNA polymerase sigma factor [Phycisphaerales bacterium]